MARAATTEELALLRSDHQRSKLYLAIYKPATVYTARVNQSTFDDPVTEITFDEGTGTLDDVLVGMTVLVGTSAGADDKGKVYIRKTPGASTFTISPTSEIGWADNDYLTVLDDFELRTKQPSLAGETLYIDWDVAYDDQHEEFDPVAVMGPHAVLKLTGSTVDFEPDGSDSWVLGSTISAYAWFAPGASATSNLDTDAPTITYNAVGWYRVSLTVTDANGRTMTGYRRVYVYNDANLPVENFELVKCMGDVENGGWEFEITLFDEADIADVYPGALCLLFAEDWYGSTKQSLGPIAGYENLVCVGRIDEETIEYDGQLGTVAFAVYGPQGWMKKISSSPAMFTSADDEATSWSEFASPTVDKALFHLLHWRSNATQIMDVFLSGDTRRMPEIDLDIGYIWDQLEILAERRMLAKGCCDRFGRLFVEIPSSLLIPADRSGITTVMAVGKDDWTGRINIEYQFPRVSIIELAGLLDDTPETVLMSRAPGSVPKRVGSFESWEGLVFDNQAHANSLSGLILARENNPYPHVDIDLAQNNRMMDVVPNQHLTLSVSATDNPRKITWTDKKLRISRVYYEHSAGDGFLRTGLECAAETANSDSEYSDGITVIPPQPVEENIDPGVDPGDYPIFPFPNINFPPLVPEEPEIPYCRTRGNGAYLVYPDKSSIVSSENESEYSTKIYYPCEIRGQDYPDIPFGTILYIYGAVYLKNEEGNVYLASPEEGTGGLVVEAIDSGGTVLATATLESHSPLYVIATFPGQEPIDIWGFRIRVDTGIDFDVGYTFDFSDGAQGWIPAPQNPTYPNGNISGSADPASYDVSSNANAFSASGGELGVKVGADGNLAYDVINVWCYYPKVPVYTKEGAFFEGTFVWAPGFPGFGIKTTDGAWYYLGVDTGTRKRTLTSGEAGKQVLAFAFHHLTGDTTTFVTMSSATLEGFELGITYTKFVFNQAPNLFNICPVGGGE